MTYTNQFGRNPIYLSNNLEIRSGTSANGEEISDEYITLGYEPTVGSLYQSTTGLLFIHYKSGDDAVSWARFDKTGETEIEEHNYTITLTASLAQTFINKLRSASLSLTSAILKSIKTTEGATTTLSVDMLIKTTGVLLKVVTMTLSASGTIDVVRAAIAQTITLSSALYHKAVNKLRAVTITLTGAILKVLDIAAKAVTITLTPSGLIDLVKTAIAPSALTLTAIKILERLFGGTATLSSSMLRELIIGKNASVDLTSANTKDLIIAAKGGTTTLAGDFDIQVNPGG